jgi:predicted Ser/Thr protein kinase
MSEFNFDRVLGYSRKRSLSFREFVEEAARDPHTCLHTSSSLIAEAVKHFGYDIVVRSGEPTINYKIFTDPFSNGINEVCGQEFCAKQIVDVIESVGKESGPSRGIILVGPPASGKTNIVDLICQALEEYTKQPGVKLYSFYFRFSDGADQTLEIRPAFAHNPILLFPPALQQGDHLVHPRQEFFEYLQSKQDPGEVIRIPTYYQHAALDKRSMNILQALLQNPRNEGKSLSEIIEEYVRIEELEFSNAQARGIANIDDMSQLKVHTHPMEMGGKLRTMLAEHLPGLDLAQYDGALVSANRGLLHIHDAFTTSDEDGVRQEEYKPLLMLLGSGKASIESTQASIDSTVIITTNIEEMQLLERQLTSSKLLDRIEKIPVNYLLDANSEMDILRRDMSNMRKQYDVDPNLLRIAAYYSVMTRLLPPLPERLPGEWSDDKKALFTSISPEQKLFIYAAHSDDPTSTIRNIPFWHPFRNEAAKLGINIDDPASYQHLIAKRTDRIPLDQTSLFSNEQLNLIDDGFMRELWNQHYPNEGKDGISVRQLQNIMRNTIAASDGSKIHVGTFLSQLKKVFVQGPTIHHWLKIESPYKQKREPIEPREIGPVQMAAGEGDYGDFKGLVKVLQAVYFTIIRKEIIVSTVDRDPDEIAIDLRRYLQHTLLATAVENRAFAHIMVPKFTYVDPVTGEKVDKPDARLMDSMEQILARPGTCALYRREIAQRFLELQSNGELTLEENKSVVSSRKDNFLECFGNEYTRLLSHRRTVEGIDPERLKEAFVIKRNTPDEFNKCPQIIRDFVHNILANMTKRFDYSERNALDTIVFAIRKDIIRFDEIIS